mmetsp:Transcript_8718/g.29820  ORF Transcript_8718/g.29820 Transcript_8718/m.29820 type:complete len:120 (-) Transcript_8718:1097-1456(-)
MSGCAGNLLRGICLGACTTYKSLCSTKERKDPSQSSILVFEPYMPDRDPGSCSPTLAPEVVASSSRHRAGTGENSFGRVPKKRAKNVSSNGISNGVDCGEIGISSSALIENAITSPRAP